jgi:hypothetical protein
MSSTANAFTKAQRDAIYAIQLAFFAGYLNFCPRYKLVDGMVEEVITHTEYSAAGITDPANNQELIAERKNVWDRIEQAYKADPSALCYSAWQQLGPNGTYKRQMLEAK